MKRIFRLIVISICFSLVSTSNSFADQTLNFDLNNFVGDGLGPGNENPNYTISGISDGDVITINVTNSTDGFLGYINNGAGNSITANGSANNTGQFFGFGDLSSLVLDQAIMGSYTIVVTIGAGGILDSTIPEERDLADVTPSPATAYGKLILDWRMNPNQANWKYVSLIGGAVPVPPSLLSSLSFLTQSSQPTLSLSNSTAACTPGVYNDSSGSQTDIKSAVYTLYINGEAKSQAVIDGDRSIAPHMFAPITQGLSGVATATSATWDLKDYSNYSARCEVTVLKNGSMFSSSTETIYDSAYYAAIEAKKATEEAARQAALVEFNSKENRLKRMAKAAKAGN